MTILEKRENFEDNNNLFTRLMEKHKSHLMQFAVNLTNNHDDAEDLIQDASIKMFMNIHKLEHENVFLHWAMRIVKNSFLDGVRKANVRLKPASLEELSSNSNTELDFEDTTVNIEKDFILRSDYAASYESKLRHMISNLVPESKEIVSLATYGTVNPDDFDFGEEPSYSDIAAMLKIETGTVRSRLHRARRRLREMTQK